MEKTTVLYDIDFETMETEKKTCLYFGKDGNSVKKGNKALFSIGKITGNETLNNCYMDIKKDNYNNLDIKLYSDLGIICTDFGRCNDNWTIEKLEKSCIDYKYFNKLEGFIQLINDKIAYKDYINLVEIETLKYINEIELSKKCIIARQERVNEKEKQYHEEREEIECKEREEEQKQLAKVQKQLEEVEKSIRNKQETYNNYVEDETEGNTVILRLMKKHGVKVPLKTQGWINKALAKIVFKDNGKISYYYYKGSKNSTVFKSYLEELEEKILSA